MRPVDRAARTGSARHIKHHDTKFPHITLGLGSTSLLPKTKGPTLNPTIRKSRKRALALASVVTAAILTVTGCTSTLTPTDPSASCATPIDPKTVKIYVGVGAFASPYFADVIKGVQTMAKSLGLEDSQVIPYESNFDGQQLVNSLSSALSSDEPGNAIILADPASPAFTKPLVELAQENDARLVTWWNRPAEIHPWDTGDGCWVAHQSYDMVAVSKQVSQVLFDSFGAEGGLVAIGGVPDNPTAKDRLAGLQEALAENPGVTLLDSQPANWDQTASQTLTAQLIGKYGSELKGVWNANDAMGLGSLEALRGAGLAGVVLATGMDGSPNAFEALAQGEFAAVGSYDGLYQGALSLALAYSVAVGETDLASLSETQRAFYLETSLVTSTNVDGFLEAPDLDALSYDVIKGDFWAKVSGPVRVDG